MRGFLIVALCSAFIVAPLRATVVVPADLGELSRDAAAIARGHVISVNGQWTDDRRTIETIVTLEVEAYLKGQFGDTLQFRVPGGALGRYRNIVVGAPSFAVGDRVIVFLGATGPMVPYVLGLNQGVFRVVQNGGELLVAPPPVMPAPVGPIVRGAPGRTPAPLADFERDVRSLAGGAR